MDGREAEVQGPVRDKLEWDEGGVTERDEWKSVWDRRAEGRKMNI